MIFPKNCVPKPKVDFEGHARQSKIAWQVTQLTRYRHVRDVLIGLRQNEVSHNAVDFLIEFNRLRHMALKNWWKQRSQRGGSSENVRIFSLYFYNSFF